MTRNRRLWLVVFLASGLLYLGTCQRGVGWQDSGEYQWRVLEGQYRYLDFGLAASHPLYIAAGQLLRAVPVGGFPARLNFFSGLGMAVALATLAVLVQELTRSSRAALLAAGMLGVSHTAWWLSTLAEVYTWNVAGLAVELLLLFRLLRKPQARTLVLLALVNGLGLSHHNFALLPAPVYLFWAVVLTARRRLPPWALPAAVGSYLIGAVGILLLIGAQFRETGDLAGTLHSALFGAGGIGKVLNTGLDRPHFKANWALVSLNFVSLLLPLAAVGLRRLGRYGPAGFAGSVGVILAIEFVFFARYPVEDQFTFFLPTLTLLALASGVGYAHLERAFPRRRRGLLIAGTAAILLQPFVLSVAPALARAIGYQIPGRSAYPYRDPPRYWIVPWKQDEDSAERFARQALSEAAPDGFLLSGGTPFGSLAVLQRLEGLSPGVTVSRNGRELPAFAADPEAFRAALAGRTLFVVMPAPGYLPDGLLEAIDLNRPEGRVLYRASWSGPGTR